jgi:hypothetical protein
MEECKTVEQLFESILILAPSEKLVIRDGVGHVRALPYYKIIFKLEGWLSVLSEAHLSS